MGRERIGEAVRIEAADILAGLWAGLARIADGLTVHLRDVDAGVAVLVSVFVGVLCGAWFVQVLERLAGAPLLGWLRLLRRLWLLGFSGWCVFPGCGVHIKARYRLCTNHFLAASRYEWEHRPGWGKKDKRSDAFYVYLLELDGGRTLYAGQTRNLMRRMQEHCAGTTKTTRGRRPVLAWFEQVPTRQAAVEKEADLKHRIDTQPEAVRGMVAAFRGR